MPEHECAEPQLEPSDVEAAHVELLESLQDASFLPELEDEALLESLVQKGCEDHQVLGQALAQLVRCDYDDEEEEAPVVSIADRLEALESPSSISAAEGLLHLHCASDLTPSIIADCAPEPELEHDSVFSDAPCEFDENAEKRLEETVASLEEAFEESVPDLQESYNNNLLEESALEITEKISVGPEAEGELMDTSNDQSESEETETNGPMPISEPESADVHDMALPEIPTVNFNDLEEHTDGEDVEPTDLSVRYGDPGVADSAVLELDIGLMAGVEDSLTSASQEQPRDLSVPRRPMTPHESPRQLEAPRAPSRESDAMQSPQPSGIPAVPSSPELFTVPPTRSKQALFLETLLSSPSPKMYTSEVTITKHQCEPLNLGKHRKSASPTVTSCSDEIKKSNKDYGEPQKKKIKRESTDDIAKITKVFDEPGTGECQIMGKKADRINKSCDDASPLKQLQVLKTSPDFNIPDPLLVPKDKLNHILAAPGREIPALLIQRPELRLPEAFAFPAILQDPDILVISLSQLENILENDAKKISSPKPKESKAAAVKSSSSTEQRQTPQPDPPRNVPSIDALAGDIDAATSAALNQMFWLPYLSQLEAMAACSQNMDFLKALNSSGYSGPNYPDMAQMFNPSARFMNPSGFPMMPPMGYDNRLQFAMWQEALNHANASSQRSKPLESQMKEISSKSSDVQNPYVHSTKSVSSKSHSSARTSPIALNYSNNQRTVAHNPFLQGYPDINSAIRPNVPLPGLQIPYYNPNLMGNQRSPRTGQQKSPTSPYFPNNNYMQSVKHSDSQSQRSSSASSQESPRPRISVKSLQNLLEPSAAVTGVSSSARRPPTLPTSSLARRRDETEVGSTTPLGEPPPHMPPNPHDPSSFHLWHPLFGNAKGYNSPWSWTTVTAAGE